MVAAISSALLPRLNGLKLHDQTHLTEKLLEMNDDCAILRFETAEKLHAFSLTHLVQVMEQLPYKTMARDRVSQLIEKVDRLNHCMLHP